MFLMAYPAKTDKGSILTAALEQVEREGVENLAIRSLAAKLGLAPNALYRYFENLAALEAAVAEEARRQILEVMQKAAGRKGPAESIKAISKAYLLFAHERPRIYALYLKTNGTDTQSKQCIRSLDFLREQVIRVYGEKRACEATLSLWAFLHGTAVLLQAGLIAPEGAFISLKFSLQIWIDGA